MGAKRLDLVTPDAWSGRGEAVGPASVGAGPPRVRVFGGIPGETARVERMGGGAHEVYAVWRESAVPAAIRVTPPCPRYLACGGCPWMHVDPAAAREARRGLVVRALAGVPLGPDGVAPVVPCPDGDAGYRTVVKLMARDTPQGVRFGGYGRHSHDVVSVSDCLALDPALRPFTRLDPIPAPVGMLRALVVRASRATGATLATLIVRHECPEAVSAARRLPADGVHLHVHPHPGDALFTATGATRHVRGRATLEERFGALRLTVGPTDFYQTNPATAARLWEDLPLPRDRLLDLYGGVGAVALALAVRRGAAPLQVLGVEESPAAVARAAANFAANRAVLPGVTAEFRAGRMVDFVAPMGWAGAMVVVNPPRRGLELGVAERLVALAPAPLVYVSCHPEALGRDLARLVALGMRVERVTPYDMFPHTPHVETVVVMRSPG